MVRRRRTGERVALVVLLLTLGHSGLAIRSLRAQASQDFINGSVASDIAELKRRATGLEQTQQWMFYTVIGGVVAQVLQLWAAAAARRAEPPNRRRRDADE